ncbi:MAG: hypothetical protein ACUVWB_12810 [Anaerolineae bacterium]
MSTSGSPLEHRRPPIILGIILVLAGLWMLGRELGLPLFTSDVIWPWFIVALGVVFWVRYITFKPRSSDDVFWGTGAVLAGGFLLAWRSGLLLTNLHGWGELWPMIPLIMGISALVQWLFSIRNWGAFIFGISAGAVGVVGLAYTSGMITGVQALKIAQFWPAILILAGIGLVLKALVH